MAAGDLADLRSRVLVRGSFSSQDTGLTSTVLNGLINDALKQVAVEHDWPWLFTTVSFSTVNGTPSYSVPADWLRTDSLSIPADGRVLEQRSITDIDRLATYSDVPVFWTPYGDQLVLGPKPNGVYSIQHRYVRIENVLSADGDKPLMPTALDDGIVTYATVLAYRFTRQFDKAREIQPEYASWLKRTQDNAKRSRRPLRVTVRPGSAL
jgi:hypothetical protein